MAQMMTKAEVTRAVRLLASPEFKRQRRFPLAVLAELAGLSRSMLRYVQEGNVPDRVQEALSPLLQAITEGRLRAIRHGQDWSVQWGRR